MRIRSCKPIGRLFLLLVVLGSILSFSVSAAKSTCYFYTTSGSGGSLIVSVSNASGGVNSSTKHTFDSGEMAYCFAQGRASPNGEYKYQFIGYANSDAAAILDAGWPATNSIGGYELTDNQARQATQAALWCVCPYNKRTIEIDDMRAAYGRTGADEAYAACVWLVETASKRGSDSRYAIYQTIDTTSGYQTMIAVENEAPPETVISLVKASAAPEITKDNSCYSLAGAVYGVYSDSACTQQVTTMTTDSSGMAVSESLPRATYYIKELIASSGYLLDQTVYTVNGTTAEVTVSVTEQPANDPIGIILTKIDASGNGELPSLAGAQFTVRFYAGQYSSVSSLPATPTRTWVLETKARTNSNGKTFYQAFLTDTYKVSGDSFYTLGDTPILPLGTITIEETKAPVGYTLDGSYMNDSTGKTVSDSNGVVLLNITSDTSLASGGFIQGGNYYTKTDQAICGGLKIIKESADGTHTCLDGIRFSVISQNETAVVVDGISYSKGDTVLTLTPAWTGTEWSAATAVDALPYGTYLIREEPLDGTSDLSNDYYLRNQTEHTVTIRSSGQVVTVTYVNELRPGSIQIKKVDGDGNQLAGAKFLLEWSSDGTLWSTVTNATTVTMGGCTSSGLDNGCLISGKDGLVSFEGLDPRVQYRLTELEAPEGYTLLTEPVFEGFLPTETVLLAFRVVNGIGFTLPHTGSTGIQMTILLAGVMLSLSGTCIFALRRKRFSR